MNDGSSICLFGIPPHRPPAVVRESGLVGESGWVSVNSRTLETQFPGVYAIGDVVQISMGNGKPLPKAGVFAEAMGETVADRIAADFAGQEPEAEFQGEGGCYLEVGAGQAMKVKGHFHGSARAPDRSHRGIRPAFGRKTCLRSHCDCNHGLDKSRRFGASFGTAHPQLVTLSGRERFTNALAMAKTS